MHRPSCAVHPGGTRPGATEPCSLAPGPHTLLESLIKCAAVPLQTPHTPLHHTGQHRQVMGCKGHEKHRAASHENQQSPADICTPASRSITEIMTHSTVQQSALCSHRSCRERLTPGLPHTCDELHNSMGGCDVSRQQQFPSCIRILRGYSYAWVCSQLIHCHPPSPRSLSSWDSLPPALLPGAGAPPGPQLPTSQLCTLALVSQNGTATTKNPFSHRALEFASYCSYRVRHHLNHEVLVNTLMSPGTV